MTEKRWWVRVIVPGNDGRSIIWPPPKHVIAYWETGHGDNYTNVVIFLQGTKNEVEEALEKGWPGEKISFFNERNIDWTPGGDRFIIPKWSVEFGRWNE
jgi:hypothetical protein